MSQSWKKYPPEFRREAVERMKTCVNVSQLARELGVRRKFLYLWKEQLSGVAKQSNKSGKADSARPKTMHSTEESLRRRVRELEALTARQSLELDFFKGALQRVEERRKKREQISEPESSTKSGN
jgi:transposase-like protein